MISKTSNLDADKNVWIAPTIPKIIMFLAIIKLDRIKGLFLVKNKNQFIIIIII